MQFKHPEILYFLFLLIVPILVHLFQLRKFKKEYFTNVRFLKEISIQTRKSSKIKKWLLLCCRLLLLTSLIIAFAQPFYEVKETKNKDNELFIVLDNSFSMQAKGQKGALLKRAVQEILEYTPQNQQFSLITNNETFWNTDTKSIQNELQNLKYSAFPFQLESALAKIKSRKSPFKKEVIVITDAVGLESRSLKSIDDTLIPFFVIPKAEQLNNVAIDSVYLDQTLNDFYKIGVKIVSFGTEKNDLSAALFNNKKLIAKTVTKLEQKEKTLFFSLPKNDFDGYVSINDNGLEYDNTLFFSISKPKKCKILSIGETEKASFLKRIFTQEEFEYINYEIGNLDYNGLENQNTIILNELVEISQALQTTLKSVVEKGGNLIYIPSGIAPLQNTNEFLKTVGTIQFKTAQNREKLITKINFNHSLYANVFENNVENFQYPKVSNSYELFGTIPSILSYEDQTPFLVSIDKTFSSVYLFTAPINVKNSNFQQSPLIVPTFYKMAMSNINTALNALKIGEHLDYFIDTKLSKEQVLKISNKTEQFIPLQQNYKGKVKLTFNNLPLQAGNFKIIDGQTVVANISFNYNLSESNLTTNNANLVSDYKIDSLKTVFNTLESNRADSQIWKWFVIFAMLFLIVEIAILRLIK